MQHDYAAAKATGRYVHGYQRNKKNVKKWEGKIRGVGCPYRNQKIGER